MNFNSFVIPKRRRQTEVVFGQGLFHVASRSQCVQCFAGAALQTEPGMFGVSSARSTFDSMRFDLWTMESDLPRMKRRNPTSYTSIHAVAGTWMIKRFRSKALKLAFDGNTSKLIPNVAQRIVDVLDELNGATSLDDLRDLTGFHELKGDRAGEYAITITANWRLTFSPLIEVQTNETTGQEDEVFHVSRVDLEDYH